MYRVEFQSCFFETTALRWMSAIQRLLLNLRSSLRPLFHPWQPLSLPVSYSTQALGVASPSPMSESDLKFLLFSCGREANLRLGSCLHALIIKSPPFIDLENPLNRAPANAIHNSLLHLYCKCRQLDNAIKLFDDMPLRDIVSWNSLISGFLKSGHFQTGFDYFKSLLRHSMCRFDQASLTLVLSVCSGQEWIGIVRMIHALAILSGYEMDVTVGNALTTSYFKCRAFGSGMRAFDKAVWRNVVTWTAVISGLAQNEFYTESLSLFVEMQHDTVAPNCFTYLSVLSACSGLRALKEGSQIHGIVWKLGIESDVCIESALMDMYAKCGCVEAVLEIFESAEICDEVSLTILLTGFVQNGFKEAAVRMFAKIVNSGTDIAPDMISAVLGVFGVETSQSLGLQVHSLLVKKGFSSNVYVTNSLINMYSKCGKLNESVKVFDSMPQKNQISWNSIIAAFARHGDGLKALSLYDEMQVKGVEPTDVTFLSLLHACSHVGLIQKGMEFFHSMEKDRGLRPRMEHYASVVDMLGRAGLLKEARDFIEGLPVAPDAFVWQSLLGACSIYGDIDVGEYAADRLARATPDSPVPYVAMANIYSTRGRWRESAKIIKRMKDEGVTKETGVSWIEIDKQIHSFVVADRMHRQVDGAREVLLKMFGHMRDENSVLDQKLRLNV